MSETPQWYYKSEAAKNWIGIVVPWIAIATMFFWFGVSRDEANLAIAQVEARVKSETERYDIALRALETGLKTTQSEREKLQLNQQQKPILSTKAVANVGQIGYGAQSAEYVVIDATLENIGFAAINIGTVGIHVFEAAAEGDMAVVLRRINEENTPPPAPEAPLADYALVPEAPDEVVPSNEEPAPTVPAVKTNASADDKNLENDAQIPDAKLIADIAENGRVMGVDFDDLHWHPLEQLTKSRAFDFRLEAGQMRTVQFRYLVAGSKVPKWFRYALTVSPPSSDSTWQAQRIETVLAGAGMPAVTYTVSKPVYETRTTENMPSSGSDAAPIPLPPQ